MHANATARLGAQKMGEFCLAGPVFPGKDEMRSAAEGAGRCWVSEERAISCLREWESEFAQEIQACWPGLNAHLRSVMIN